MPEVLSFFRFWAYFFFFFFFFFFSPCQILMLANNATTRYCANKVANLYGNGFSRQERKAFLQNFWYRTAAGGSLWAFSPLTFMHFKTKSSSFVARVELPPKCQENAAYYPPLFLHCNLLSVCQRRALYVKSSRSCQIDWGTPWAKICLAFAALFHSEEGELIKARFAFEATRNEDV